MPTARKYGAPQVSQAAIPGARKQAAETDLSTGAGFQQAKARKWGVVADVGAGLANQFTRMAEEQRVAADQTAVLEANVARAKWVNERLYHPDTGALGIHGKDAMPLPETVGAEYRAKVGELTSGLHTDRQRAAFARDSANDEINLDGNLRRHVAKEMQTYQQGVLEATVATSTSSAISNASDPRMVGIELKKATDAITQLGPHVGLSPEQISVAQRSATTAIHKGVIERLLQNDNDKGARAYYEETKDQIDGQAIAHIEAALDEGTLRGSSQRKADEIVQAGGTLTKQLEAVRNIEDPKLRDAVRERVEHEAAVSERAEREQEEANSTHAFNLIDKSHNVASIPPAMWSSFSGATKSSLRSYAEHLTKGIPVETDDQTFYALMEQAGTDRAAFLRQNLLDYKGKLSEGDFQQLTGLKLSIRNNDAAGADKVLGGFRTKTDIIENSLTQYGIDPKNKAMAPAIAQLQRMLDRRIEASQANGQKVTNVEIQAAVDDLLSQKETVPGSWWGFVPFSGKSVGDTSRKLVETTAGDIPAGTRTRIEAGLRSKGRPVSDATVLDVYTEMLVK